MLSQGYNLSNVYPFTAERAVTSNRPPARVTGVIFIFKRK